MSVTQGILPFKLVAEKASSIVTSFAGLPLVMETMKALKIPHLVGKNLKIKQRDSGKFTESDYVESFIGLIASGGECLDDMERLRADVGLLELGFKVPSTESARFFLYAFHEADLLKGRPLRGAFVPEETKALKGLMKVQEGVVVRSTKRQSPTIATIDQDAVIVQSNKEEAQPTYLGEEGYQPMMNYWAEEDLILADEFRDGNVTASYECYRSLKRSIEMLPDSVREVRFRADSAAYQHKVMDELRGGIKIRGRRVRVRYAISTDMTPSLKAEIMKLSETAWKPLRKITEKELIEGRKEWAEVEFVPTKGLDVNCHDIVDIKSCHDIVDGDVL
jgi:hypothetical protein